MSTAGAAMATIAQLDAQRAETARKLRDAGYGEADIAARLVKLDAEIERARDAAAEAHHQAEAAAHVPDETPEFVPQDDFRAAEAAPPRPQVRVVGGPPMAQTVPLIFKYEFEGEVYEAVTVRRMTTADVVDFVARAKDDPDAALGIFDVPEAVIDGLMPDDQEAVSAVVDAFLPAALRPRIEA